MKPKKPKGTPIGVYNTISERDQARKVKRDPYPPMMDRGKTGEVSQPQWMYDTMHPERDLAAILKTLLVSQGRRLWESTFFMSLYANVDFMTPFWGANGGGLGGFGGGNTQGAAMPRMSNNLIRVCTEALAGKLIQGNSRIAMQTRQGDYSEWRKARKIEMALDGEFQKMKLYKEIKQVAIDAITQGDGFLKLYPSYDGKSIECERLFPNEVFVDELEAAYQRPTKMYQLRYARKDDIYAWYPDKEDIIRKAGTTMPPRFAWTLYQPGMVEIYEAWALPVGNRPGRHIIAVSSGCLVDEPWDKPYFPIIRFKGGDRPFGWYGAGFTEQVAATQIDLNKTLNVMQRAAHLGIAPYWVVPEGGNVNFDHLTNGAGHVVQMTSAGNGPQWVTNPPFHAAATQYVEMLENQIMTYFGMNEMETTGQLPPGVRLDSGEALNNFQNIGSVRHTMLMERWQEFFVDIAERTCMLAVDIAKNNGGYPVMVKKAYAKACQLDWQDLEIEKDAYMMNAAPANLLPFTQAGKLQKIQDLKTDGLISPAQAARLMTGPADIEAILNEVAADEDDIDRLIEQFSEHKEYRAPSALQNLPLALQRVAASRLMYANLGADDDVLRLFDRYLSETKNLIGLLQQAAAPQPGVAGASPNVGQPNQSSAPSGGNEPNQPGQQAPGPQPTAGAPGQQPGQ